MAHGTTVAKVASDNGTETAIHWADHIIETLEHHLRTDRGILSALAETLLKDTPDSRFMATVLAKEIVKLKAARKESKDEWEPT